MLKNGFYRDTMNDLENMNFTAVTDSLHGTALISKQIKLFCVCVLVNVLGHCRTNICIAL